MTDQEHGHDHEHDHEHEGNITDMLDKITLTLEDDSELVCGILGVFEAEEEDRDYIALVTDDGQVLLYRYIEVEEEDELELDAIATDEEYQNVKKAFEELFLEGDEAEVREE